MVPTPLCAVCYGEFVEKVTAIGEREDPYDPFFGR